MITTRFSTILASSVFMLLAIVGVAQAMEMTSGDSTMKKDDEMMQKDSLMMSDDLYFGSRGEKVVILQTFLESHSFLVIPTGVAKGYFGPLTQAALMKYQASVDVPSTGYYGPITRGVMEKMMMKKDDAMMQKDEVMMKDDAMMEQKPQ